MESYFLMVEILIFLGGAGCGAILAGLILSMKEPAAELTKFEEEIIAAVKTAMHKNDQTGG